MPRADRFDDDRERDHADVGDPFDEFDDDEDDDEDIDEEDVDEEARDFYGEHTRPMTPADTVAILAAAAGTRESWLQGGQIAMPTQMVCRVCGCSDEHACEGGCFWAAPNLCSRCVA